MAPPAQPTATKKKLVSATTSTAATRGIFRISVLPRHRTILFVTVLTVVITTQFTIIYLFLACDGYGNNDRTNNIGVLKPVQLAGSFNGNHQKAAKNVIGENTKQQNGNVYGSSLSSLTKDQYSFETIPSRTWKIYEHSFPCYPVGKGKRNKLMDSTPCHEGILFQRPKKVGSTTVNNVVLRLVHNRAAAAVKKEIRKEQQWKRPPRCEHRTVHGKAVDLDYANRNKEKSFLFSLVRDPTKRMISWYFWALVTGSQEEPTNSNFRRHAMTPGGNNQLIYDLTFDRTLGTRMAGEFERYLVEFESKHPGIPTEERMERKDILANDRIAEPLNYTTIVQDIIDSYDFIAVTERMDESLVVFKLLLGLSVEEILYAKISRSAGSFGNGSRKSRPCVYQIPAFLTDGMRDFFYNPQHNDRWIEYSKGDALLHQAANKSLDRTINEVFGRELFQKELREFRNAKEYAMAVCSSEPDLVVEMCDQSGRSVVNDKNRSTTCYIGSEGCDHQCLNERIPNPIPQAILNGTQKFVR